MGEQVTRHGKEETVTGTGTRVGTGTRTGTGISTRAGMGARTGAGAGMRIEMNVEGRESLGTFEVVIVRKTREGGQRQPGTSYHSRKIRRPSETVASCEWLKSRDGR